MKVPNGEVAARAAIGCGWSTAGGKSYTCGTGRITMSNGRQTVRALARPGIFHLGNLGVTLAIAMLVFQGCAGSKKPAPAPAGTPPVTVEETSDLPQLAKAIKTKEDSLILDLLL